VKRQYSRPDGTAWQRTAVLLKLEASISNLSPVMGSRISLAERVGRLTQNQDLVGFILLDIRRRGVTCNFVHYIRRRNGLLADVGVLIASRLAAKDVGAV
jgi:hypothetical protein